MIQRITKNTDINFSVDDAKIAEKFIIKFFTTSKPKAIVRTAEDVVTEADGKKYIKLPWSTLRLLNNGMLNYEVQNLAPDSDYNDGVFDTTFTAMSKYYIYSDVNDTDTAEVLNEKLDILTDSKQDKLTAGDNITISGNVISASGGVDLKTDRMTIGNTTTGEDSINMRILRDYTGENIQSNVGDYSVGIGVIDVMDDTDTKNVGEGCVAVGYGTTAKRFSTAVGCDAYGGESAVALGSSSNAHNNATALGDNAFARPNGVSVGLNAKADGEKSVAVGANAQAKADGVAIGYGASVNSGGLLIKANNKDMIRADINGKIYLQKGNGYSGTFCLQDVLTQLGATL